MTASRRPWLPLLLAASVLSSQTGCVRAVPTAASYVQQPPELSTIVALGPTGVAAVWGTPEPHIAEPPSGWLAGAAAGALVPIVGGLAVGSAGGSAGGYAGALWLFGWTAVGLALAPVGAVAGAVAGALTAPPPEQVKHGQAAIIDAVSAADLPAMIRDEAIRLSDERSRHGVVPMTGQGPETADHEVGTVLEIVIRRVGLEGRTIPGSDKPVSVWISMDPELELRLDVDTRLLKALDGSVLYSRSFRQVGAPRTFSEWTADHGRQFRDGLRWVAERSASHITTALFPLPEPLAVPQTTEPPAQGGQPEKDSAPALQ
jgi:hypothetical protein